jgi:hypothetical protein
MALEARGDIKEAEKEFRAMASWTPMGADLEMAYLLPLSGHKEEGRALLKRLTAEHPEQAFDYVADYAALGDRDSAFQWLEESFQRRLCYLVKVHPFLDPLRGDARYSEFLKRIGLAD